jgi:hypothetical protein
MAIISLDNYLAAQKQDVVMVKTQTATAVAAQPHTLWDRNGNPGAGSLAVGNTANGLVPTDATTGAPLITNFAGGARGYISNVEFGSTVAGRIMLYDRLFHVGSIALNSLATTTLSSQPSFGSRVSLNGGAASYVGLRIYVEINAAVSATATTVTVTYTNQSGTTGRTTGTTASLSGFITGRLVELPLQAGDSGVQTIESITVGGVVATTGTVNVFIARPLWSGRVRVANDGDVHGFTQCGFPEIFQDSCLALIAIPDSTSTGIPDVRVEIASG